MGGMAGIGGPVPGMGYTPPYGGQDAAVHPGQNEEYAPAAAAAAPC